jgi:hypothetical protein
MSEPKPFASLSPTLLARKGAARPAMRPQLQPLNFSEDAIYGSQLRHQFTGSQEGALSQDDLGWNDMGEDAPESASAAFAAPEPTLDKAASASVVVPIAGSEPVDSPVVGTSSPALRQLEDLADLIAAAPAPRGPRKMRSALREGRKAAFTLRVDGERHLRLRLACTLQNRSAQQLVTEALDRLLEELPGLDELARRVKRH